MLYNNDILRLYLDVTIATNYLVYITNTTPDEEKNVEEYILYNKI